MVQPLTCTLVGTKMEKQQLNENNTKQKKKAKKRERLMSKNRVKRARRILNAMEKKREAGMPYENEEMERLRCQAVIDEYSKYSNLTEANVEALLNDHRLKDSRTNKVSDKVQPKKDNTKQTNKEEKNRQLPEQKEGVVSKMRIRRAYKIIRTIKKRREAGMPIEIEEEERQRWQAVIDKYLKQKKSNKEASLPKNNNLSDSEANEEAALNDHDLKVSTTNEESDKVQQGPNNSRRRQGVSGSLQSNELSMALANDIDGLIKPLEKADWPKIENELSELLLKHLLKPHLQIARYESGGEYRGFFLITSKDNHSKSFLTCCVKKIRHKFVGMSLTLIPLNQIDTILSNRSSCDIPTESTFQQNQGLQLSAELLAAQDREKYLSSQRFLRQMENVMNLTSCQSKHLKKARQIIKKYENLHGLNTTETVLQQSDGNLNEASTPAVIANEFGNSSSNHCERAEKPTTFANEFPELEMNNEVRSNPNRKSKFPKSKNNVQTRESFSTPGYSSNQPNSYFQSDMQRMPPTIPPFHSNLATRGTSGFNNRRHMPNYSSAAVRGNTFNERSQFFSNSNSFMQPAPQTYSQQARNFQTFHNQESRAENFNAARSTFGSNYHRTEFPYRSNRKF